MISVDKNIARTTAKLLLEINRDDKIHKMAFAHGAVTDSLKAVGDSEVINGNKYTGTKITFLPSTKTI